MFKNDIFLLTFDNLVHLNLQAEQSIYDAVEILPHYKQPAGVVNQFKNTLITTVGHYSRWFKSLLQCCCSIYRSIYHITNNSLQLWISVNTYSSQPQGATHSGSQHFLPSHIFLVVTYILIISIELIFFCVHYIKFNSAIFNNTLSELPFQVIWINSLFYMH